MLSERSEITQAFVELACKMTRDILKQTLGNFHLEKFTGKTGTTGNRERKETTVGEDDRRRSSQENNDDGEVIALPVGNKRHNVQDASSPNDEVSIKSVRVESFNDCIKILEGLNLVERYDESE